MSASIWNPGAPVVLGVTMTLAQAVALTITVAKNMATQAGGCVELQGVFSILSAGTPANGIKATLTLSGFSINAQSLAVPIGWFFYQTSGGTRYTGVITIESFSGTGQPILTFFVTGSVGGNLAILGISPAVTAANGDFLSFSAVLPLG